MASLGCDNQGKVTCMSVVATDFLEAVTVFELVKLACALVEQIPVAEFDALRPF